MITIFIIVPHPKTLLTNYGSGGFVAWARLTYLLNKLGYKVFWISSDYHEENPMNLYDFCPFSKYLNTEIYIASVAFFKNCTGKKYLIVGGFGDKSYLETFCRDYKNIIYFWCHGDLIRYCLNYRTVNRIKSITDHPILLCNSYLLDYYPYKGQIEYDFFDNFIDERYFYIKDDERIKNLVGYQEHSEWNPSNITYQKLSCTGDQKEVGNKLRKCDYFLWIHPLMPNMLSGCESFGMQQIEAMNSGCIVLATKNNFTKQIYPEFLLIDDKNIYQCMQKINILNEDTELKKYLRKRCIDIGKDYKYDGFNNRRINFIKNTFI